VDVVGIHQILKVPEWSHGEAKHARDQDDQGEHAPRLGQAFRGGGWNRLSRHLHFYVWTGVPIVLITWERLFYKESINKHTTPHQEHTFLPAGSAQ
jgi:hypothetical protein